MTAKWSLPKLPKWHIMASGLASTVWVAVAVTLGLNKDRGLITAHDLFVGPYSAGFNLRPSAPAKRRADRNTSRIASRLPPSGRR